MDGHETHYEGKQNRAGQIDPLETELSCGEGSASLYRAQEHINPLPKGLLLTGQVALLAGHGSLR